MIFRADLVFFIRCQASQPDLMRRLVAIGTKDVDCAAFEARVPVKHSVPMVTIWPRKDVVHLDILQDRSDPGFINLCCAPHGGALLRRPTCAMGGIDLPLA